MQTLTEVRKYVKDNNLTTDYCGLCGKYTIHFNSKCINEHNYYPRLLLGQIDLGAVNIYFLTTDKYTPARTCKDGVILEGIEEMLLAKNIELDLDVSITYSTVPVSCNELPGFFHKFHPYAHNSHKLKEFKGLFYAGKYIEAANKASLFMDLIIENY